MSEAHKHALLERAAIHLMPSRKEGWGLAVIEAAQHGVPTIAFADAGGVRESIRDGETGWLVSAGCGETGAAAGSAPFREAVAAAVGLDARRRAEMSAAARQWAGRFSWQDTGRRFAQVLEQVAR